MRMGNLILYAPRRFPNIIKHFLVLFLLVQFSFASMIVKDEALIENVCKKTHYYELCIGSLKSDPRSSTANVKQLAQIILDATLAKFKENLPQVHKLLSKATDPSIKQCLNLCLTQYGDAIDEDIPTAMKKLELNDFGSSTTYASWANENVETCEDSFSEVGHKSPLTSINNYALNLSSIAVEIIPTLGK